MAAWGLVIGALCAGVAIGLAAMYFIRLPPSKVAKDFVETLSRETDAQRKAHIDAILSQMRDSFGSFSVEAVSRSTREFVKFAQAIVENERDARAKARHGTTEEVGQQLREVGVQLERLTELMKELDRDRGARLKDLTGQVRTLREALPASSVITPAADRKRSESALRDSERRFDILVESSPIPFAIVRVADDMILAGNPQFGTLMGLPSRTIIGHKFPDVYANPADWDYVQRQIRRELPIRSLELKCKKGDGTAFSAVMSMTPLMLDGHPALLYTFVDTTEWKQAAERVKGTLSLLHAVLDCTADGMLVVDRHGRIVTYNHKFVHMWRVPEAVMEARSENQLLMYVMDQLKDYESFLLKIRKLNADPIAENYDVLEFNDGRLFEWSSVPQRLENATVGRVWSYRDVTERKWADQALEESEEQLRQSQKMEAIGRLAGGIAHDLNNILTIITGYSHFLLTALDRESTPYHDVGEIQQATRRAEALIQQLLAFSRKQPRQPRTMDLNEVIAGMISMLQRLVGEEIRLQTSLCDEPCPVLIDPNQMAQVLMNLLVNARDAMPDGGVVMLGTGIVTLDQTYARAHPGTREGAYVTLAVKDRGVGMDSHTLAHCFEPFFTTKARGQGTGLGLATVYGIIKQSDGSIEIDSEPGRGTTVQVYLPKLDNVESVEAAAASSTGTALGGSETILLVEDDAKVRKLIRHTIERLGYQVFEAPSGAAALALAQAHDAIDLLLTDVVMPEMSGAELANQLGAWRPELKILFMSGYTEYARKLPDDVTTGARLLLKPFTPDELARKVRDVLDTPSQESVIAER